MPGAGADRWPGARACHVRGFGSHTHLVVHRKLSEAAEDASRESASATRPASPAAVTLARRSAREEAPRSLELRSLSPSPLNLSSVENPPIYSRPLGLAFLDGLPPPRAPLRVPAAPHGAGRPNIADLIHTRAPDQRSGQPGPSGLLPDDDRDPRVSSTENSHRNAATAQESSRASGCVTIVWQVNPRSISDYAHAAPLPTNHSRRGQARGGALRPHPTFPASATPGSPVTRPPSAPASHR